MIQTILKYFPLLSEKQRDQFSRLMTLYPEWNEKINVISRKDIDNLEVNHLLHSLSIAKFISFTDGSRILDLGCGGGLPGLPLAIMYPDCEFHLVDRIGKKVKVAAEIAKAVGLENVTLQHGDSGECERQGFDFVVSRAVMPLPDLVKAARPLVSPKQRNPFANGLITLKGGELTQELARYIKDCIVEHLSQYFPDDAFFETKELIYLPLHY